MKRLFNLSIIILLLSVTSCHAQKIMRTVNDAKKLEINQNKFVGKTLKVFLDEIGPKIKSALGEPDNKSRNSISGTYIKLFFVDRDEARKRYNKNEESTGITVWFQLEQNKTRKPIPVGGLNISSKELEKEYGDMIIQKIYVNGKN